MNSVNMRITLPKNNLHKSEQEVNLEKVTVLIGENGAGKSSVLQSIFIDRLSDVGDFQHKKIVCFSSGQNEKYSKYFSEYLSKERQANRGLNLGCCYYDKIWSCLLIFIATITKKGLVRNFLIDKNYVDESSDSVDDLSSTLKVNIRVEKPYVNRVKDALKDEENGEDNTFRSSGYHQTLESFIRTIVDAYYDFDTPLKNQNITLTSQNFFNPSFSNTEAKFFEPIITFFTQAADNDYFFDKKSMQLMFKNGLTLNDLSDGEYQIIFLYALLDLFDSDDTFFLLDEVDSHLHFKNIERLWIALHNIKGHTLTTTHLLDSITSPLNKFENIKIVDKGAIKEEDKTKIINERLSVLSRMKSVQFEIWCKLEYIVLMDDYNDWIIFLALAERKGMNIKLLADLHVIKQASSYGSINEILGKTKLDWVKTLLTSESKKNTKDLFLICDRDEAKINFKKDNVSVSGKEYTTKISGLERASNGVKIHLLAWNRREIKNYLLSYTALSKYNLLNKINNDMIAVNDYLKENDSADNKAICNIDVKTLFTGLIDTKGIGLDKFKLNSYINYIPPEEISDDIANMYNYIVRNLKNE